VRQRGSSVQNTLSAMDHYFGPRLLVVGCLAGIRPWTGGQIPQNCVLDVCVESGNPFGLSSVHVHEAGQERIFLFEFTREPSDVLFKVSDFFICLLQQYTVLDGRCLSSRVSHVGKVLHISSLFASYRAVQCDVYVARATSKHACTKN